MLKIPQKHETIISTSQTTDPSNITVAKVKQLKDFALGLGQEVALSSQSFTLNVENLTSFCNDILSSTGEKVPSPENFKVMNDAMDSCIKDLKLYQEHLSTKFELDARIRHLSEGEYEKRTIKDFYCTAESELDLYELEDKEGSATPLYADYPLPCVDSTAFAEVLNNRYNNMSKHPLPQLVFWAGYATTCAVIDAVNYLSQPSPVKIKAKDLKGSVYHADITIRKQDGAEILIENSQNTEYTAKSSTGTVTYSFVSHWSTEQPTPFFRISQVIQNAFHHQKEVTELKNELFETINCIHKIKQNIESTIGKYEEQKTVD